MTTSALSPDFTAKLTQAIREAGQRDGTEEDLKLAVEQALAPVREAYGIGARYERSYPGHAALLGSGGSSDAVYGHAVLRVQCQLSGYHSIRRAREKRSHV